MSRSPVAAGYHGLPVQERYPAVVRLLHWASVVLIAAQFAVVWSIPSGDDLHPLWNTHVSLGLTVLAVALVRITLRMILPTPALPSAIPLAQRVAAKLVQVGLYFAMVAMPILGWLKYNVDGATPSYFGLFRMPVLVTPESAFVQPLRAASDLHQPLGMLFLILIGLHIAAALYHGIVRRDGVMSSMAAVGR